MGLIPRRPAADNPGEQDPQGLEIPQVLDDDDDPVSREQAPARKAKILPFGLRRTPDWLTGPGDEMGAAPDPQAPEPEPATTATPVLTRPGVPAPMVELDPGIEPASASAFAVPSDPPADAAPERSPAAPSSVEPRRAKRPHPAESPAPWAPVASSVPVPRLSLVEKPEPEPAESPVAAPPPRPSVLPGREDDLRVTATLAPGPAPLVEPWWVVAFDNLRANRRAQLAVAGVLAVVVVTASWMWPRGVGTTPLSQIRRHPSEFDGRDVVVRGRVGDDVFAVGAGWAFYLMQGRDTIVTFSLSRMPEPRKVVTLKGQVSTGFLDGMPRQALFEGGAAQP